MELLKPLRDELGSRRGDIKAISRSSGVGYDTILRIRDEEDYEPGFSKIVDLARSLNMKVSIKRVGKKAE